MMQETEGRMDHSQEEEEQTVCEPLLLSTVEAADKPEEACAPGDCLDMVEALDLSTSKA